MPATAIPPRIANAVSRAHLSWQRILRRGLEAIAAAQPAYLAQLESDHYLPTDQRLFAAFALPLEAVRFVLVGEGPYPRAESATGVCFMDGAVGSLWCDSGLAKPVNRATSLRNFVKMLLVADGRLRPDDTGALAMAPVALAARSDGSVQTLAELQARLTSHGFLLLNASLVFRPTVAPAIDAKAWLPFLQTVLDALSERHAQDATPTLVLWGKIAEQLARLPETARFPQCCAEHPYNLSFIAHEGMHKLFGPMRLLSAS
jgi:uracil-DNA glycosylase